MAARFPCPTPSWREPAPIITFERSVSNKIFINPEPDQNVTGGLERLERAGKSRRANRCPLLTGVFAPDTVQNRHPPEECQSG
jgi:hypothetical protein